MEIEFWRLPYPSELGEDVACGLCLVDFQPQAVNAAAFVDTAPVGVLCVPCLTHLEARNPARFSGISAALELANRIYPEPMFPSAEAQKSAIKEGRVPDGYAEQGGVVRAFS